MNRIPHILIAVILGAVTLSIALCGGATAFAVQAVAHGQGVLWKVDHSSWLGNYELDDGNFGYCIDVVRPAPHGADFDYVDGGEAGWFSPDDSARLAFISREWGAPADPLTAAAAQLAVWTITGLAGHDQAYFAQRANADADLVLRAANHMIDVANGGSGASRGASATVELALDGSKGTAVSQLTVDYLTGPVTLAPGSFEGRMTLHGATFDGGGTSATVGNAVVTRIHPTQSGSTEKVSADIVYDDLPFGPGFRLGRNTGDSQNLLVTHPFPTSARASDEAEGPTGLPFQPQVQTTTSAAVAEPGAVLTDTLELGVHPDSPTGEEWGVYEAADGSFAPIPVVIESVLLGPFPTRPVEAEVRPSDAPVVCTVETAAESGPGTFESPPCAVPEPGYYVWTDSIDPARTPFEKGGDRLMAWASRFGVASETTVVPATPTITTTASTAEVSDHGCVSDRMTVTGLPEGGHPITVTSTLLGPIRERPAEGSTPDGWREFPVAGAVSTTIAENGTHESPCITVKAPGFYYFVFESAGSAASPESGAERTEAALPEIVPAFSDTRVHESESVAVSTPPASPTPTAPPVPATAAAPVHLAQTGAGVAPTAMSTALAVCAIIAGLAGLGLATRRWR
jgi:hypothetical protein